AQGCGQNDSDITTDKAQNFITEENKNEGTTDWQLTRVRVDGSKYRTKLIEGYCSHQSISKGEKINFYVSTDPGRDFTLDIYRMGYYEGKGGRHMMNIGPLKGTSQAVPEKTSLPEQLRECNWTSSHSMVIPDDWLSGVYLGKLKTIPISGEDPYWESYIIFIVKDDRQADVLFQCSDNTWQAYNRWPENESLYTHPQGAHIPGVSVSFNRPYGMYCQIFEHPLSMGSGEFLLWEYPLCFWLEKNGYDVTYGSNRDCINIDFIRRCFTFLSVGHDEYWDIEQYNAVKEAINMGTNVLWLSGNSVFMVSPFSNDAQGNPGRRLTRQGSYGELRAEELASYHELFGNLREAAPDERDIMGVRSVVPFNGGGDWICTNPDHWIFKGTGMKKGDFIPGLVGWEHHGDPDFNKPGLEILAEGMIWSSGDVPGKYASVIFNGPQNNFVFNASTIFWSQALSQPPGHILPWSHWSRPQGTDQRVQQIMHNLLAKKG
ncbi:MAG: hypothetical protein KDC53_01455, partial [Saprospiraceae bacterium]|nr:hypothetical protein [Saprospiraceae bacterium]